MKRVRDWDRYIYPLLFAMRDTPHNSTTFSSFDVIYVRPIRGPMAILKELWTIDVKNAFYVFYFCYKNEVFNAFLLKQRFYLFYEPIVLSVLVTTIQ
jgi:hypothetical protein